MNTTNKLATITTFTIWFLLCVPLLAGCAPSARTYTVQPGDTLAKIAQANDTTVGELVDLNKTSYPSLATNPGAIEVGWTLKLPGGGIKVVINTPSTSTGPTAVPLDRDAFEMEIVRLVNEERVKAGLAPLEVDPGLMQFARERSEDMVAREYFDHTDPATGEDLTPDAGENIYKFLATTALTNRNAMRAVSDWMKSEGHRKNILRNGITKTGVGAAIGNDYIIVTQLFVY